MARARVSESRFQSALLGSRRDRFLSRSPVPAPAAPRARYRRIGGREDEETPSALFVSEDELAEFMAMRDQWAEDFELYARVRLGMKPTWQQAKIMAAISPPGAKVTVRSGHGIGKSGVLGGAALWHMETQPNPKGVATAPTAAQLNQVLWSEITKWSRKADSIAAAARLNPALWLSALFQINTESIRDRGNPRENFFVARTSNKPDALQGFHASNLEISDDGRSVVSDSAGGSLLFEIEEGSGVDDAIFEVAEGALSSKGSRLLMAGNPTRNSGYFSRSHKQDRASFSAVLHFRTSDSPLADPDYRARLVKKFGEGSNVVRVRADGEFPKQDDDALMPFEAVEAAIDRVIEEPPEEIDERTGRPRVRKRPRRRLGVDVARYGSDRTVRLVREGRKVLHIAITAREDTMETTGRVVQDAVAWQVDEILVDVTGLGAGVVDRLREIADDETGPLRIPVEGRPGEYRVPEIIEVAVAESAPERSPEDADEQGYRLRDHLWLVTKRWILVEEPSFAEVAERELAQDLAGELSMVRYWIESNGTVRVESKDDMKKHNEGRSPDIADALVISFHEARRTSMSARRVVGFG